MRVVNFFFQIVSIGKHCCNLSTDCVLQNAIRELVAIVVGDVWTTTWQWRARIMNRRLKFRGTCWKHILVAWVIGNLEIENLQILFIRIVIQRPYKSWWFISSQPIFNHGIYIHHKKHWFYNYECLVNLFKNIGAKVSILHSTNIIYYTYISYAYRTNNMYIKHRTYMHKTTKLQLD